MDSQVGKGSVFPVSVLDRPRQRTHSCSYDGTDTLVAASGGKHIVFIDDEAAVREGMEHAAKAMGYTVTIAGSLEEICASSSTR